jgi:hypothetical protein
MRANLRVWDTLACFVLLFGVLVAAKSDALDKSIQLLVCGAFLMGSVILIIKSIRHPLESRRFYFGQTAWLPSSWRRWILDEKETPSKPTHR